MLNRLKNNWSAKIVALGMALLLWFYVNNQIASPLEEIYSNIPIEVVGLSDSLALTNKPPSVQVRVTGSQSRLASLNARDIKAVVELSSVGQGTNLVPVNIVVPAGIEVISVLPAQVNLNIDRIVEERWPVVVKVTGSLNPDYQYLEPQVRPNFVFLVGANNVLEEVREVFVSVELTQDMVEDLRINLPLQVVDKANIPVTPAIRSNPQWVEVLVPIKRTAVTKTIPITYELAGDPPPGYQVRVVLNPSELTVHGLPSVLEQLESIAIQPPIDVTKIEEKTVLKRSISLPQGVESIEGEQVEVSIQLVSGQ